MISFFSQITRNLSKKNIKEIINLKETHWSHGIKSQKEFFKKNLKPNDLHNLLYFKKKLIGYTCLRKLIYKNKNVKIIKYLHFDTIIIKKKYREKKYSNILMLLNNCTIKASKKPSLLFCQKNMVKFYKIFKWKIFKEKINLNLQKHSKKEIMIYE